MDWSRAKTILIVTFIIFDLFLGAQLSETMQQKSMVAKTNKMTDQQVNTLLKTNQIQLKAPKPADLSQMHAYNATITPMDGWNRDYETGGYKKTLNLSYTHQHELKELLNKQIPFFEEYRLDQALSSGNKIVYLQMKNEKPIFDGKIEIHVAKGMIESVRVVHYDLKETTPINLISFNNALVRIVTNEEIQKNSSITQVELGYRAKAYRNASQDFILFPYWRFHTENQILDLNATILGVNENVETVSLEKK